MTMARPRCDCLIGRRRQMAVLTVSAFWSQLVRQRKSGVATTFCFRCCHFAAELAPTSTLEFPHTPHDWPWDGESVRP